MRKLRLHELNRLTLDEFKKSKSDIYPKQYFWQDVIEKEFIRNDFAYCPEDIYNKIYEKTYLLMDLFARSVELEGCNIHDFLNIINMYANSFYSFLKREKVLSSARMSTRFETSNG